MIFCSSKKKKAKKLKKLLKRINFDDTQDKNMCYHFDTNQNKTEMHDKKNISLCCHVFSARMLHNNWLLGPSRTFVPKENYSDSGKAEERQHLKTLSGFWVCILRMYAHTCTICLLSERSDFTWKASQFYTTGTAEKNWFFWLEECGADTNWAHFH